MPQLDPLFSQQLGRVSTATLTDLIHASDRLSGKSHGRVWSYIDSATSYAETALFSLVRLVKHFALALISAPLALLPTSRHYALENICKAIIDVQGTIIGLVGTAVPFYAQALTARLIYFLNANGFGYHILSERDSKKGFSQFKNIDLLHQMGFALRLGSTAEAYDDLNIKVEQKKKKNAKKNV